MINLGTHAGEIHLGLIRRAAASASFSYGKQGAACESLASYFVMAERKRKAGEDDEIHYHYCYHNMMRTSMILTTIEI